jgi:hypothetical protein
MGQGGPRPRCFVASIKGDLMLTQNAYLSQLVSFIISVARPNDEVGLAAASMCGSVWR